VAESTSICLFGENTDPNVGAGTVIIFGVSRGGTSMVAGAVRGFGYDLGDNLAVNQEDTDFCYKTDEHMKHAIETRNSRHSYWGWKFPMAADYIEQLLPMIRNPMFIIIARDPVAAASGLVRWDNQEPSGAIAGVALQTLKNITISIRMRLPTLYISYEKASRDTRTFLIELETFLARPLVVDRERLHEFMVAGRYKSYEEVVLRRADVGVDRES
jgi:hypothetical protein